MEGTYPLPEAQRDRFTAQVAMGYPSAAAELAMLDNHLSAIPLSELKPVTDVAEVSALIEVVRTVHIADDIRRYVVDLMAATRRHPELRLGASPRAGLQLLRTARAAAAFEGRNSRAARRCAGAGRRGALAPAAAHLGGDRQPSAAVRHRG